VSDALFEEIERLASTRLEIETPVRSSARLAEDLGLDSLQRMTLAVEIENHFRICLDPEDEAGIETLADLVSIVRRKTREERPEVRDTRLGEGSA